MALTRWATHVLQWQLQWAATGPPVANPQKVSQFGLFSATREHEGAIASNRGSACRGEYVPRPRSEEHTSELQALMRISYAVFCLKNKIAKTHRTNEKSYSLHSLHTS